LFRKKIEAKVVSNLFVFVPMLNRKIQGLKRNKEMNLKYCTEKSSDRFVKGGPEPSNFEDLCLVNVSVKYFSKLCFGTIKNST